MEDGESLVEFEVSSRTIKSRKRFVDQSSFRGCNRRECAPSSPWHRYQRCFTKDVRDKRQRHRPLVAHSSSLAISTIISPSNRTDIQFLIRSKCCHWNVTRIMINRLFALPFQAHTKGESHHDGGDAGTETYRGEHEDSKQREVSRRIREGKRQVHPGGGWSGDSENQAEQQNYLQRGLPRRTSKEGHHGAEKDDDWWKWRTDRWVVSLALSFIRVLFLPPSRIVLSVCIRCFVLGEWKLLNCF